MKKVTIAFLFCASAFGQVGTALVNHQDYATAIPLATTNNDMGTGASYATFPVMRVDPTINGNSLSGVPIPTTAAITGNTSAQSVVMSTTDGFTVGDFILIDGGLSVQEMTNIQSITDATHLTTVFNLSHSSGARIRRVFTAYSKYLWTSFLTGSIPTGGLNNISFIRNNDLPPNVYDSYKLIGTGGGTSCSSTQIDSYAPDLWWQSGIGVTTGIPPVPQYSTGSLSTTKNPTNGVALPAIPHASATPYLCVQVYTMFTANPEPSTIAMDYRFYWDY